MFSIFGRIWIYRRVPMRSFKLRNCLFTGDPVCDFKIPGIEGSKAHDVMCSGRTKPAVILLAQEN